MRTIATALCIMVLGALVANSQVNYTAKETIHSIDWSACQAVTDPMKKTVEKFNLENAATGMGIWLSCQYGGDKTKPPLPEKHIDLTSKEIQTLHPIREQEDKMFSAANAYETYLLAAHHVHEPNVGDKCYYFVGIKVNDDFITVDPNSIDPECQ